MKYKESFISLRKRNTMKIRKNQGILNPFYDGINIPDELFCDRKEETKEIIELITNGNKVVLKAPRRIGKSSLIKHILQQKEISNNYNILYLDLFGTNSAQEFIRDFQRAFINKGFAKIDTIKEIAKSLPGKLAFEAEFNELTRNWKGRFGIFDFKEISMGLDTIFNYLENTTKPNIVVFDEFQQIKYYPEPMAAILRSYVQTSNNIRFIFSGSSRRMISTMFNSYGEPFYHSAESVDLDIISEPKYEEFCIKNFKDYGKEIESEAIEFAYDLAAGNTYEIQRIMRSVFASTEIGKTATTEDVKNAVNRILDRQDQTYREKLNELNNTKERKVFIAIALEGVATKLLSKEMIKEYDLGAVSSISQSLDKLCGEDKLNLVLRNGDSYVLQDKMFELWMAKQYNLLDMKFISAKQQFKKEIEFKGKNNLPDLPKFI